MEQQPMAFTSSQSTSAFQSEPTVLSLLNTTIVPRSFSDISSLYTFLLINFPGIHDWFKLVVIGGFLASLRSLISMVWSQFLASFFITVHFEGDDDTYDWIMVWLSRQPAWKKARELQISSRNWGAGGRYMNGEEEVVILSDEDAMDGPGSSSSRKLSFLPSFGTTHTFFYKKQLLRVSRDRKYIGEGSTVESLTLSIFGRSHRILHTLLKEAKEIHKSQEANRVGVYIADPYNNWRWSGSRPKRPLNSIILDANIKETLIEDAKDFMNSEAWYAERGIPFRRGYLLHGEPGSGKTSLIHAVAGALDLDIYVLSLSKRGLDDATLNELICALPARSIALMEDIDAAFTHGVNRDGPSGGSGEDDEAKGNAGSGQDYGRGVTLSGLLGAIDGVAAQEGRLLFATTNKYHVLDAALIRPGRLDLHIEFHLASTWQAGEIFKCFYPASTSADELEKYTAQKAKNLSTANGDHEKSSLVAKSNGIAKTNGRTETKEPVVDATPSWELLSATKKPAPKLTTAQLNQLAERFMSFIPERTLSMAAIQGHLMSFKTRPEEAVVAAEEFVRREQERKLARELEKQLEREAKKKAKELAQAAKAPADPAPLGLPLNPTSL